MPDDQKQFVIQEHTSPADIHWDLMLEQSGSLQTFRLYTPPGELLTQPAQAVKIADHDLKFLTYQGPVNKGTGNVEIVDKGTFQRQKADSSLIEMDLTGRILKGSFTLTHIKKDQWQFAAVKH